MKTIKQKIHALPDLIGLELSLVIVVGLLSGMILGQNIPLIPPLSQVLIPALIFAFLSFGLNSFNAVFDRYLDMITKPHRPLPRNVYSPKTAFFFAAFFYLSAILLSLEFNAAFYLTVFLVILLSIAYSLPPVYLKGMPFIGTLIPAIIYGILPIVGGYVLFASFSTIPISLLIVTFLFAVSCISIKDFESYIGDRRYEIRTFPVLFGKQRAVSISISLLLLPYLLIAILAIFKVFPTTAYLVFFLGFWALMIARSFYFEPTKENSKIVLSQAMLLSMLSVLLLSLILVS